MCAAGADGTGANPLKLQCASQRDQIWRKGIDSHGDYNPTCTNSTENITKDPSMPENYTAPANCSGTFADFLNKTSYPNSHELIKDKLWLQWRRAADGNSIEARMAYDGGVFFFSTLQPEASTRSSVSSLFITINRSQRR